WARLLTRGDEARDLAAALEARIDQPHVGQSIERLLIRSEMLGLAPHRRFPREPEPRQVLIDRRLMLRAAARSVDVLDAQQQTSVRRTRHVGIDERAERVPEMQIAVRAWREAEDWRRHVSARIWLRGAIRCRCFALN